MQYTVIVAHRNDDDAEAAGSIQYRTKFHIGEHSIK